MASLPGNVLLLGSPCPLVPMGSTVDRKRMELPNKLIPAWRGEVKDIWVHTVLGLKVAGRALINIVVKVGR